MTTVHAWFSLGNAIRLGSAVYRKPGGTTVNVTRTDPDKDAKGRHPHDEKYVGQVVSLNDGGCVQPLTRIKGITS